MSLTGVILAGGSGSRFWPLSRERYPKQLLKIIGRETMLQQTIHRIRPLVPSKQTVVVTTADLLDEVRVQVPAGVQVLEEPVGRNTAPAIGLAAMRLCREDPEAIMVILPADHIVRARHRFLGLIRAAAVAAREGYLVLLGLQPERPETGYGYLRIHRPIKKAGAFPVFTVDRFVEKPDTRRVTRYLKDGRYYWNSGIFVWKAAAILEELRLHLPRLFAQLQQIQRAGGPAAWPARAIREYASITPISIDYGVLERSRRLALIPCGDIGWHDVGSWSGLADLAKKDGRDNVISGNVIDLGSRRSILYGEKRLIATIGLEDLVLVDTADATLVCRKDRSQEVRQVVEELKRRRAVEYLVHRTVSRPWGSYTVLEEGERYKVKRVVVRPGARLSLQLHRRRSEHWVVVSGVAEVTRDRTRFTLRPNESTYIPPKTRHRLANPGQTDLELIEVQSGAYLGEDDILRLHDDYGRLR